MGVLAALAASACISAPVFYVAPPDAGAPHVPWIHAGPVVGYLFYYGASGPWKTTADRALITTGGGPAGGYATKILWRVRGGRGAVSVIGRRLDGPGAFRQRFSATASGGGTFFPSVIKVPDPGCWRVTVASRGRIGRFAFVALSP
jgi:hypothetical protein